MFSAFQTRVLPKVARSFRSFRTAAYVQNASNLNSYKAPIALLTIGTIVSTSICILSTATTAECASAVNIDDVKKSIVALIDAEDSTRTDGSSITGTLVRLGWHASGTYSATDKSGGSNGSTMRYSNEAKWGANAGLDKARNFLEPIKKKYPSMSYADIWTLAAVTAVENAGGPKVSWRSGRTDSSVPTTVPDGRLPNADKGASKATAQHLRDIFYRMGFNDREIVALAGAHCLGRCHTTNSGYTGPWTNAESTFSNEYFRLLVDEKWTVKKTHEGKEWKGPLQYEDKSKQLMMLPSDMVLIEDPEFKKYVDIYAKDEDMFFRDFSNVFTKLLELGCKL